MKKTTLARILSQVQEKFPFLRSLYPRIKFENKSVFNIRKRKLYTIGVQKNQSEEGKSIWVSVENFGVGRNAEKQR